MEITLNADDLRPVIREIVKEVITKFEADHARLPDGRLAYTAPEAAALLGVQPHVLSDARRRGVIDAVMLGKRYLYPRETLLAYLRNGKQ